ncbi:MAG: STAS domain-containing protein [Spirochaetaceae bacterium]|jgi:anti-anti-sigma factor|nr:STAS domain-containing protein [Spirochaetaceae bacterium]
MIDKKYVGVKAVFTISGKMDAITSPELELELKKLNPVIKELIFDFENIEFISSIGLRNVLLAFKLMKERHGKFNICNIPEQVRNVFEMSGFMSTFQRDEKLVVIEKSLEEKSAVYSIMGSLDAETSSELEKKLFALKSKNLESIAIDCEKLSSITSEGCTAIKNIHIVLGSNIVLYNANEEVSNEITKSDMEYMLPTMQNNNMIVEGTDTVSYVLKKEWELSHLPFFKNKWYEINKLVKNVIIDFSTIKDISSENFAKLNELRRIAELNNVKVDIKM